MLWVHGGADSKSIELLKHLILFGHNHCAITIIEGILYADDHEELFMQIEDTFNNRMLAYYFDIPFEETLKRHEQKQKTKQLNFGESEMKTWWREKDFLSNINENIIHKDMSLHETVDKICRDIKT
ncbi:MAG: uridine kinase [Oscillospiraceae bacterium]|nr:uridine kinase [Oscillospiraceae bacterium]